MRLALLEQKHSSEVQKRDDDVRKRDSEILRLKQALQRSRKKVVGAAAAEGVTPVPFAPTQVAPTAAVKPTVTTTPTASIRPMAIQTTTAPTAHVTPTMVTNQHVTVTPMVSHLTNQTGSAAAAAVFVRSSSPQVVTPLPTVTVSTSLASTTVATPIISVASTAVAMPIISVASTAVATPIISVASTTGAMPSVPVASTTMPTPTQPPEGERAPKRRRHEEEAVEAGRYVYSALLYRVCTIFCTTEIQSIPIFKFSRVLNFVALGSITNNAKLCTYTVFPFLCCFLHFAFQTHLSLISCTSSIFAAVLPLSVLCRSSLSLSLTSLTVSTSSPRHSSVEAPASKRLRQQVLTQPLPSARSRSPSPAPDVTSGGERRAGEPAEPMQTSASEATRAAEVQVTIHIVLIYPYLTIDAQLVAGSDRPFWVEKVSTKMEKIHGTCMFLFTYM